MDIKENISLAEYSLFGIGGNARYFAEAASAHEAAQLVGWARTSFKNTPARAIGELSQSQGTTTRLHPEVRQEGETPDLRESAIAQGVAAFSPSRGVTPRSSCPDATSLGVPCEDAKIARNAGRDIFERGSGEKGLAPFIFILGGGSNILVADEGFDGLVIRTAKMRGVEFHGENFSAESGVAMGQIARLIAERGLSGMEWAVGIPGTLGGSIRGNAGCYGSEIKDVLTSVLAIDIRTGETTELNRAACKFAYRDSIFKRRPELIILSAEFKLNFGDAVKSRELIKKYSFLRVETQDIGVKCAGCFFKNADWRILPKKQLLADFSELEQFAGKSRISAGFLIDQAGLLGHKIGGAAVSGKHGNFIVNANGATARDIAMLADLVKEKIFSRYGIALEEEVQRVGFI